MDRRAGSTLIATLLIAPAAAAVAAHGLAALGVTAPGLLLEAGFARLGVTNGSPLLLRQAWYLGLYILAPGGAAAVAGAAALATPARRMPLLVLAALGLLHAAFWIVWSLADA
jgi:hypothetical protein